MIVLQTRHFNNWCKNRVNLQWDRERAGERVQKQLMEEISTLHQLAAVGKKSMQLVFLRCQDPPGLRQFPSYNIPR